MFSTRWGHRHTQLHPAVYVGSGNLNSDLWAYMASMLQIEHMGEKTQGHRESLICFHLISSCLMSLRGRETGTRKTFLSNTGGKLWCAILPLPRSFTFVLDTRWHEPPASFSGFFRYSAQQACPSISFWAITFWIQIIHFYIGGLSTPGFLAFVNLMQRYPLSLRIMLVKSGRGHISKL